MNAVSRCFLLTSRGAPFDHVLPSENKRIHRSSRAPAVPARPVPSVSKDDPVAHGARVTRYSRASEDLEKENKVRHAAKAGAEAVVDVLLLAIGAAIAYISWGYGFGSIARPGPGLYPFFVGSAIASFAAILLASHAKAPPAHEPLEKAQRKTLALMAVTFCFWILAMPLLGYVIVTGLATLAFCKTMKLEGWRKPISVATGISLFIYLVFDRWLYIDLPRGMLFGAN